MDGILRKEALVVLTNLSRIMSEKLKERLSHIRGWVNGWIVINISRLNPRMIHGAFLLITLWYQDSD